MDASWVALAVAGIAAVPGTLALLGARADRKAKQREAAAESADRHRSTVVDGYDRLVDDLEAANARLVRENAELRAENAELRGARRPRPGPHRTGGERR